MVPSPLREQIAHAIRDALDDPLYRYGTHSLTTTDSHDDALVMIGGVLAEAVLPLVEAAVAAERQKIDAYIGSAERHFEAGLRRGAAAERLRLHTQLRDQADAAAEVLDYWATRNGAFAVSSVKRANRESAREAWLAALDRALLGVAATPQPARRRPIEAAPESELGDYPMGD